MKGNEKVLAVLSTLVQSEVTAMVQYRASAQILRNAGFKGLKHKLHGFFYDENTHSKELLNRLLLLGGAVKPESLVADAPSTAKDVSDIFANILILEYKACKDYNAAVRVAEDVDDNGSAKLFRHILHEEEDHTQWFETQIALIGQIGKNNYLTEEIRER